MQAMSAAVSKSMFSTILPKGRVAVPGKFLGCLFTVILAFSSLASPAHADPKYAGIVVDAKSGKVLYGEDPDGLRYPASLTKMMTLYLTFEALEAGRITLDTRVPVSAHAASEPPSKLGVRPGGAINVDQAIRALVTRSANDMATALGEFVGGSEDRFAQMMTNKARALGMTRTTYRNAHGLPNTAQMTTARDQARLGIALRQHFPQYYGYFSIRTFNFGKQTIGNHNRLVGTVRGVDGIKTGYTRAAGSNLATSAQLDGRSIVAVVLGGRSSAARDATMRKLVAEYLPKASRGGQSNLISQAPSAPVPTPSLPVASQPRVAAAVSDARQVSALDLPNSGPMPGARYDETAAPAATAYLGEPSQKRTASAAMNSAMLGSGAVPTPAPEYVPKRSGAGERTEMAAIDSVTTASTRDTPKVSLKGDVSGWVIQIGVSPNPSMANELLQDAQDKGGKVLRSAKPFTVAFSTNGGQVYRARFGGFGDQKSAIDACNILKKKGVNCWASIQ
ncbi:MULTISPECIES: D-alanyl-D-alanine carboxypeptidase [Rhizobium]|uniref:D-alanyl-D-alanine carboxypeptidase n=1 Tax=Rhizobium/Agrobacterium group TaxID=227290 RepID=UPI000DDE63F4|nr:MULTISPECIES: D-alanyl-D-alanine carboxypeptidase [Rhizobium]MBD8650410.1 SPOR domain-containing protein [Rhizobium sp. CFBP 13726]